MKQRDTHSGKGRISPVMLLAALSLVACGQQDAASEQVAVETEVAEQETQEKAETMEVVTELQIIDVAAGEGPAVQAGQQVVVHYTGWLYEPASEEQKGAKFDSSVDRGQPFAFPLGGGRVIRGWDEGVAGMQVGGKRILIIPPDMAYGERGAGGVIPANATLLFEVELLEIQ
jgi:FKBP-type peptidyl-prolyl cis-trans isomerase FkpA